MISEKGLSIEVAEGKMTNIYFDTREINLPRILSFGTQHMNWVFLRIV